MNLWVNSIIVSHDEVSLMYFHYSGRLCLWKRPWCWERLRTGGEGSNRGWDGWMASWTQRTWVWTNSKRRWRTGKPGVLQSMGSQRFRHNHWATATKYLWCWWVQFCSFQSSGYHHTVGSLREGRHGKRDSSNSWGTVSLLGNAICWLQALLGGLGPKLPWAIPGTCWPCLGHRCWDPAVAHHPWKPEGLYWGT